MRKKTKEIKNFSEIEQILTEEKVIRVGFSRNNIPYIVPMNFGYEKRKIYCHTGFEGMKIDFLKTNDNVCIEIDRKVEIISQDLACNYTCDYESVIGFGKASIISDPNEKQFALNIIMKQITGQSTWTYLPDILKIVAILKIELIEIFGKRSIHKKNNE